MMTKLTSFLCVLLFAISPATAQDSETRIAKVALSEIEHLVESIVLARPENKELGERFRTQREKSNQLQKQIQESMLNGEKFDLKGATFGAMNQTDDRKEVETLGEKYLLEVIEKVLEDKYQVVFKDSYSSSLLYTKIAVDDVTLLLKQELLRQLPTRK